MIASVHETLGTWQTDYTQSSGAARAIASPRTVPLASYFVRNQTGVPITYWVQREEKKMPDSSAATTPSSTASSAHSHLHSADHNRSASSSSTFSFAPSVSHNPAATHASTPSSSHSPSASPPPPTYTVAHDTEQLMHVDHPHQYVVLSVSIAKPGSTCSPLSSLH